MSARARTLGFASVLGLGLNTIVGSGIFRFPAELSAELGPASIFTFALGALACASVALCFAELGGLIDGEGGVYAYAQAALGPGVGFAVGWSAWVATVLTLATVASALPGQLAGWFPALAQPTVERGVAAAVVLALGALNYLGRRPGVWASGVLVVIKLAALALFVVLGLGHVRGEALTPLSPRGLAPLGPALLVAFFALSGFETCAVPAGEAKQATRNVPLAVLSSIAAAAGLYTLVQLVVVGVLPGAGSSKAPLADAARVFLGEPGATAMAAAGTLSILGLCAAMAFAAPRLMAALADDRHLPAALGRWHPRFDVPRHAVSASTAAAALLALTLDFRSLVDFTSVTLVLQYLAACVAVPVLRRRWPDRPRRWRVPLPLAILGIAPLLFVVSQCRAKEIGLAAIAVASGFLLRPRRKRS